MDDWKIIWNSFCDEVAASVQKNNLEKVFEEDIAIGGKPDIISCPTINLLNRELHHSETMGPVYPSLRHCFSMRFSAACLISSERLKRAKASSYVTFLTSIIVLHLLLCVQI